MDQKPTVGRIVHFYSDIVAAEAAPSCPGNGHNGVGKGPYAAVITQVFEDAGFYRCNLTVFPPCAAPFEAGSVELAVMPGLNVYFEFPPRV